MLKIYLDNCCYNRPYDDQTQIRITLETEAKLYIQSLIVQNKIDMVWSYILILENSKNTNIAKKIAIKTFSKNAVETVYENENVLRNAKEIEKTGIKPYDALHISCAIEAKCEYFVTTDDRILKYNSKQIKILDPIGLIKELERRQ
ncbi:MAG: PIN domain-containing protein [Lachnospiraceae bacterium]|jgi:predicted nucleic acid-binding protein|nr:PIN domain-containing protein [Lachnospiraceae bacterium]